MSKKKNETTENTEKVSNSTEKVVESTEKVAESTEKVEKTDKKASDKKFWICTIVGLVFVGIITFVITYIIRGKQIDKEFQEAFSSEEVAEIDEQAIKSYIIYYNDKEYSDVTLLIGVITEPETLKIRLTYANDDVVDKEAYISFNSDIEDLIPHIKDGDYVQIIMPSLDADIPSYSEFLDTVASSTDAE
jgi:hypothetical protein